MPVNPGNIARGLKAAISNPRNSEEAKQRAQDRLDKMSASGELSSAEGRAGHVERGHKAAMSNFSNRAKQHPYQILEDTSM